MNETTAKILARELEDAAKKLRAGTCSLTEEEAINLIDSVSHIEMNKEEACNYLKVSRDTFDRHVNLGTIGKKERPWHYARENILTTAPIFIKFDFKAIFAIFVNQITMFFNKF